MKSIDWNALEKDVMKVHWEDAKQLNTVEDKVKFLNNQILYLYDKHAPLERRKITKKSANWMTYNIKEMIKTRNAALSRCKKTKLGSHWKFYTDIRNYITSAIRCEKIALQCPTFA